jgi:hypothetical protein
MLQALFITIDREDNAKYQDAVKSVANACALPAGEMTAVAPPGVFDKELCIDLTVDMSHRLEKSGRKHPSFVEAWKTFVGKCVGVAPPDGRGAPRL